MRTEKQEPQAKESAHRMWYMRTSDLWRVPVSHQSTFEWRLLNLTTDATLPDWVLFDDTRAFPDGYDHLPRIVKDYARFRPGHRKILMYNLVSKAIALKSLPFSFLGNEIEYTTLGPRLVVQVDSESSEESKKVTRAGPKRGPVAGPSKKRQVGKKRLRDEVDNDNDNDEKAQPVRKSTRNSKKVKAPEPAPTYKGKGKGRAYDNRNEAEPVQLRPGKPKAPQLPLSQRQTESPSASPVHPGVDAVPTNAAKLEAMSSRREQEQDIEGPESDTIGLVPKIPAVTGPSFKKRVRSRTKDTVEVVRVAKKARSTTTKPELAKINAPTRRSSRVRKKREASVALDTPPAVVKRQRKTASTETAKKEVPRRRDWSRK